MTWEGQTTQELRAGTTGSVRHGGRASQQDPYQRHRYLCPTKRRLRSSLHARRRDPVRRGIKRILDDNASAVGVLSGHYREALVPVPEGDVKMAHGVVKDPVMDLESRQQS